MIRTLRAVGRNYEDWFCTMDLFASLNKLAAYSLFLSRRDKIHLNAIIKIEQSDSRISHHPHVNMKSSVFETYSDNCTSQTASLEAMSMTLILLWSKQSWPCVDKDHSTSCWGFQRKDFFQRPSCFLRTSSTKELEVLFFSFRHYSYLINMWCQLIVCGMNFIRDSICFMLIWTSKVPCVVMILIHTRMWKHFRNRWYVLVSEKILHFYPSKKLRKQLSNN